MGETVRGLATVAQSKVSRDSPTATATAVCYTLPPDLGPVTEAAGGVSSGSIVAMAKPFR